MSLYFLTFELQTRSWKLTTSLRATYSKDEKTKSWFRVTATPEFFMNEILYHLEFFKKNLGRLDFGFFENKIVISLFCCK